MFVIVALCPAAPTSRRTQRARPQNWKTILYYFLKEKVVRLASGGKMQNCWITETNVIRYFKSVYCIHTLLYQCHISCLGMIKSVASEAILTSRFKSEMSLLVLMNFYSMNCASKILKPMDACDRVHSNLTC